MRNPVVFLAVAALCSVCASVAASPLESDIAKDLLERGAAEDAWLVLESGETPASGDTESWFVRGMAAKATGRFPEAINAFERVLELDPRADRARLELAEASFSAGDAEAARRHLLTVKANNPPARVGENIDRFLELLKSAERKNWRVFGSLGYMYDTNANAGPASNSVLMYGLPFTLSPSALKNADDAALFRIGFDHGARLGDNAVWQSGLSLSHTDYRTLDDLDAMSLAASSGPSWQVGESTAYSVPLVADWLRLGHSDSYYSYSVGIAPQVRRVLSAGAAASLTATVSRKWYFNQPSRDLHAWSIAPDFEWKLGDKGRMNAAVTFAQEDSGLDRYSNSSRGANVAYGGNVNDLTRVSLSAHYFDTRYRAPEPAFPERRRDQTARLNASVGYRIQQIESDLTVSLSYTDNRSNLPLYAYNRTQFSVSVGKSF